jgi:hypothetical protein
MRKLHTLALAAVMALSGLGCATAPTAAVHKTAQPVAESSCRDVTDLKGKVQSYCATPAQWAEFDSRMAQLDQGFSCRPVKGSQPLCLFARQWDYMKAMHASPMTSSFGDEATRSAVAIEHNEYAAVRQDLINSNNGRPVLIP